VVRIERLDDEHQDVEGADPDRLLVRIHLGIGDTAPELIGPRVAGRAEAQRELSSVLERIYAALGGSEVVDTARPAPPADLRPADP
jgi:hypothetical protein